LPFLFGVCLVPGSEACSHKGQILWGFNPLLNFVAEIVQANKDIGKRVTQLLDLFFVVLQPHALKLI
jgi:hypothetical protein